METKRVKLRVYGMTCEDCAITVARKLKEQNGVVDVKVSLKDGSADVELEPSATRPEDLLKNPVFRGSSHYRATLVDR
ncbi:MAG: cation transporter [Candidatus Thermoplasmatota archaeon]|nr:cation transporter [Candidatus Thermoplasmatota archaeon]